MGISKTGHGAHAMQVRSGEPVQKDWGRALAGWGRASGAVREWVGAVASARGAGLQCWGRAMAGKWPD